MQKLPEKLYLAKQVRELDRIAIEEYGIAGIALMRKAGGVVFDAIKKYFSDHKVVVFCGAGNNAGDGYVVAKLALRAGFLVELYSLTPPENLQGDAFTAYQDYLDSGGSVSTFQTDITFSKIVVIDALFGTGLSRKITGQYAEAIALINASGCVVIAVDIPSGLNADSGAVMACAVKANYTVTFIALKQGMFSGMAAEYCGNIIYASLDIPEAVFQQVKHAAKLINSCHLPRRHRCSHKGYNGHVLSVGGDEGFSGAIRLAAEASLRTGAGLVSVATRKKHAAFINFGRPEIMSHAVETVNELLPLIQKASVIVIGPGLGQSQWANNLLVQVLQSNKPLVIDADALNLLSKQQTYNEHWILTPHPGEAARLLNSTTAEIAENRFLAVEKLQKKYGGVAVLKGAGTLIKNASELRVSTTGNPGMASGGMGDVLAGMIAALVAQGLSLEKAASHAVFLHGKAADLSAQKNGEVGLLASDLLPFIRQLANK